MKRKPKRPPPSSAAARCEFGFGSCVEAAYVRVQLHPDHDWFRRCLACATRQDDEGRLHRAIRL